MSVYITDKDGKLVKVSGNILPLSAQAVALNTTRTGQNDTVVEYYMSSDTNFWYRKWASGWKECGGKITGLDGFNRITFPLEFSNTNFTILKTLNWLPNEASINRGYFGFQEITTNSAVTGMYTTPSGTSESWYACGY